MNKPEPFIEVFMSLIKWFLVFVLINNLIWGLVLYGVFNSTSADVYQSQDGTNNVQEMTNG